MCNVYIEIADHLKIKIFKIKPVEQKTNPTSEPTPVKSGMRTRSQVKKSDWKYTAAAKINKK